MKNDTFSLQVHSSDLQKYWSLDPKVTFLNHGSFGACPLPVLAAQQRRREQLEQEPVRFFIREWEPLIDAAREKLANFVGADPAELVFVPNATTGVNSVLRSLDFDSNDELLTTDQEYNACRNALNYVATRTGAKIVVAPIPFPITAGEQMIEAVMARVTEKTKLVLLDHITSQTGLIFPIQQLIARLTAQGIETLIDGAHAPGMVPLNLHEINPTYYTGNCHKWLCAPKGAAFLYVQRDRLCKIHPVTISHGANSTRTDKSRFQLEFDWMGTHDPTPYLCVPEAIAFMGSLLKGGWHELMEKNRTLALTARKLLCESLGVTPPCPDDMIGALAVIPLPDESAEIIEKLAIACGSPEKYAGSLIPPLQNLLWECFQIEVPIIYWPTFPQQWLRISAQIYNTPTQYEYLAQALAELLPCALNR